MLDRPYMKQCHCKTKTVLLTGYLEVCIKWITVIVLRFRMNAKSWRREFAYPAVKLDSPMRNHGSDGKYFQRFLPSIRGKILGHWEAFCLSSSVQVIPLDVTIPRNSYAWNYRELATLFILSESLADGGLRRSNHEVWSNREEGPGHCSISKQLLSVQISTFDI